MKFHWECKNQKCLADNKTVIDDIFVGNGNLLIDLGPCCKCGNPHRKLTIWNQHVSIKKEDVTMY